jgi:hypothetical protein
MIRAALLATLLAGPAAAQQELPEGYPPVMGHVFATVDGKEVAWQTYDFSIGAFDASAWITDDDETGVVTLRIMAYAPGEPDKMQDRLWIQAEYPALPKPGDMPQSLLIEVLGEEDIDGRKLTSGSTPAALELDRFSRDDYAYGRVAGRFAARICLKPGETEAVTAECRELKGLFDTSLQFDSMGDF